MPARPTSGLTQGHTVVVDAVLSPGAMKLACIELFVYDKRWKNAKRAYLCRPWRPLVQTAARISTPGSHRHRQHQLLVRRFTWISPPKLGSFIMFPSPHSTCAADYCIVPLQPLLTSALAPHCVVRGLQNYRALWRRGVNSARAKRGALTGGL